MVIVLHFQPHFYFELMINQNCRSNRTEQGGQTTLVIRRKLITTLPPVVIRVTAESPEVVMVTSRIVYGIGLSWMRGLIPCSKV